MMIILVNILIILAGIGIGYVGIRFTGYVAECILNIFELRIVMKIVNADVANLNTSPQAEACTKNICQTSFEVIS